MDIEETRRAYERAMMRIPFHNNCRQGWGCHPDCPVLAMARENQELQQTIANLERELQKRSRKKNNDD